MERNSGDSGQNFGQGSTGGTSGMSGASGGSAGYGATGAGGSSYGEGGSTGVGDQARGAIDRAGDEAQGRASQVKEKASQAASTVREKAGNLKMSLADQLERGAEALRHRSGETGGTYAGATGEGSMAVGQNRLGNLTESVAGGMQNTADWLREADLDGLKTGVERQVKEHPGRTLLIALGVGYLIGKAFRK